MDPWTRTTTTGWFGGWPLRGPGDEYLQSQGNQQPPASRSVGGEEHQYDARRAHRARQVAHSEWPQSRDSDIGLQLAPYTRIARLYMCKRQGQRAAQPSAD